MDRPRPLAYITGTVDQELLLRNEYLAAENRILKGQIETRLQFSDAERATLSEIAHRLDRKSLEEIAVSAKPDTILGWYRKLIANVMEDKDTDEDLRLLFAPGSSLGGARPKASVIEKDGHLAIAKFPRVEMQV